MTQLYLIHSGEARSAVERRMAYRGPASGLTELGRAQAARLRDCLAATGEIRADVLIASPYTRA